MEKYKIIGRFEDMNLYLIRDEEGETALVNGKSEIIVNFGELSYYFMLCDGRLEVDYIKAGKKGVAVFGADGEVVIKFGVYDGFMGAGDIIVAHSEGKDSKILTRDNSVLLENVKSAVLLWDNQLKVVQSQNGQTEDSCFIFTYDPSSGTFTTVPNDHEALVAENSAEIKKTVLDFIAALREPTDDKLKALMTDEFYGLYVKYKDSDKASFVIGEKETGLIRQLLSFIDNSDLYSDPHTINITAINPAEGGYSRAHTNMDRSGRGESSSISMGETFDIILLCDGNGKFRIAGFTGEG